MGTLSCALLVASLGSTGEEPVRHLLGLQLKPGYEPGPKVLRVLVLAAHNIPIVAWPLLLSVVGAHRSRLGRTVADVTVLACITVNVMPVGLAIGAYGVPLLPYIPQLPLEWGALALGASGWLLQRRHALSPQEGLLLAGLVSGVLLGAAGLETFVVPHV